jgi:hypothetical protein
MSADHEPGDGATPADLAVDLAPGPRGDTWGRRRGKVGGWTLTVIGLTVLGWVGFAALIYFWPALGQHLFPFASLVLLGALILASALTVTAAVRMGKQHGWRWAAAVVAFGLASWITISEADLSGAYLRTRYTANRGEFAAVNRMARAGAFGDPSGWNYYGTPLPRPYRHLSVNGNIASLGTADDGSAVLFIPVWFGIPDDAGGFAHSTSSTPPSGLDVYGDRADFRFQLGDGWWWVD